MTRLRVHHRRSGFTLVELLVVIGLVLFLMSISIVALSAALGIARENATKATIIKVHGLMQQRIDAFNRAMEKTNLTPASDKLKRDWFQQFQMTPPDNALAVLVRKQIFQSRFPQNFNEKNLGSSPPTGVTYVSSKHQRVTESAALLYWILTSSEVYGIAPVDESAFSSSEVRDTDGDGLLEFVDGWGRPLRFYRSPTHLFRPGTSSSTAGATGVTNAGVTYAPINRTFVGTMWSGLPAAPTLPGELDPLSRDPDDPTSQLSRYVLKVHQSVNNAAAVASLLAIQNFFGTPDTYHAFLIVSAGPDGGTPGGLGMEEPFHPNNANNINVPAEVTVTFPTLGTTQGRLGALSNFNSIELNPINDNITNRKR